MNKIIYIFFLLLFTTNSYSEIKDKRVYDNFFNSCMEDRDPSITYNEMSNYCSCAANGVMKKFTVKELVLFESKISAASKEDELRVAAANEKFMNIIASCAAKLYE